MFEVSSLKKVAAAAGLIFALGAMGASAATCTARSGGPQTVTYTLTQGAPDAVNDFACFDHKNDSNTILPSFSLFGLTGWTLAAKTDDDDGDGKLSFSDAPTSGETSPGLWAILNPKNYAEVVVTLVQGNSFAAFLLDSQTPLSGNWLTAGPGGSNMALSHASIYYRGEPGVAPIPLPAAGWLLVSGLAGLGVAGLRRRRKDV